MLVLGIVRWPGSDLLSRALSRSTMGAVGFHVRVRNGVGWVTHALATKPSNDPFGPGRCGGAWNLLIMTGH